MPFYVQGIYFPILFPIIFPIIFPMLFMFFFMRGRMGNMMGGNMSGPGQNTNSTDKSDIIKVLKMRYAKGEIDKKEYEEKKRLLED